MKFFDSEVKLIHSEDIGTQVICDFCGNDYSFKSDPGGMIFESKAVCPDCTKRSMRNIKKYGEEKFIRAFCPPNTSFWNFVFNYRKGNNTIKVYANGD